MPDDAPSQLDALACHSCLTPQTSAHYDRLVNSLRPLGRVIVAFSAGVDSTLVLKAALDALGSHAVLAATGVSPSLAARELRGVRELAEALGAPLELVRTAEMDSPQYASNPANRCYFCKTELYTQLSELAKAQGYQAILNGTNLDDLSDHRPGLVAAREWSVRSPLVEAGLHKEQVRELARELGLPNWQKPALACLSSRIPYGTPVTIASLSQIEKAEAFLWDRGFANFRVRHHSNLARIEASVADLHRLTQEPLRSELVTYFKNIGYTYVTVDLQGFRSGSGNDALNGAMSANRPMDDTKGSNM